jgi:ABC-type phosphate transport system substrate-binding protein
MNMNRLIPISLFIAFAAAAAPGLAGDDDLVVVVNKSNSVDNVTKAQLKKMILGEQPSWSAGKKVSVVLRATGQPERDGVLRSVCGMSEDDFNQSWMRASFNGSTATPPKSLPTGQAVRQSVAGSPGAIGFLRAADVDETVKPVTVDGIAAGQPDYKIKAGK